jgi:hypothetical protein
VYSPWRVMGGCRGGMETGSRPFGIAAPGAADAAAIAEAGDWTRPRSG